MVEITTNNFKLKYLSEVFHSKIAPTLREVLTKGTRPYCVLIAEVKGLKFALPLRSNLPNTENIGIRTIENKENPGKYKGIDFSKAILIKDSTYLKEDSVQLKERSELLFIQGHDKAIIREFKKYVQGYITAQKNNSELDEKYRYSTLQNYHKELKI